jgi:hypothetical protein
MGLAISRRLGIRPPEQLQWRAGPRRYRQAHVLQYRQAGEKVRQLERAAHALLCALGGFQRRHVLAEEIDAPRAGAQFPGNQVEERGLAGAVRTHDRGQHVAFEAAGHRVDGHVPAEPDAQLPCFQGGFRRRLHRRARGNLQAISGRS